MTRLLRRPRLAIAFAAFVAAYSSARSCVRRLEDGITNHKIAVFGQEPDLLGALVHRRVMLEADRCPSAKEIAKGIASIDPWGTPRRIDCIGRYIRIRSAGSDGQFGTGDDLVASADWRASY